MCHPVPRSVTVADATPVQADDRLIMLSDGVFAIALTRLVAQGEADAVVPDASTEAFVEQARAAGNDIIFDRRIDLPCCASWVGRESARTKRRAAPRRQRPCMTSTS